MPRRLAAPTQHLLPGSIGFVLIPQFALIALACAIEPLRVANRYLTTPYHWQLLSADGEAVPDDNGILVQPNSSIQQAGDLGTVIVCADIQPERHYSPQLGHWLQHMDSAGVSLGAIDTGCFLLARAGLLERCRVTMHWEVIEAFRERFPNVAVEQTLFEIAPRRLTCAGGTAALDMMLSAIAVDHGVQLANRVAEHCLHSGIRPADAAQRMVLAARSRIHHPALARAMTRLEDTLERPINVQELADHAGVSPRHLLRLFAQFVGEGPGRYHRRLRLEHARSLLRYTAISVTDASTAVGFESPAHFSRAYRQQYGQSPTVDRISEPRSEPLLRDRTAHEPKSGNTTV